MLINVGARDPRRSRTSVHALWRTLFEFSGLPALCFTPLRSCLDQEERGRKAKTTVSLILHLAFTDGQNKAACTKLLQQPAL